MYFKDILKKELYKSHWEILEKGSIGEWYEDEHWKIQWKHKKGKILYIQFLLDRLNHIDYVRGIEVKETLDSDDVITFLSKSKKNLLVKIKTLVRDIETYRKR